MLTKGTIEKIVDKYSYKVRIPIYDRVRGALDATPTELLYTAYCNQAQGLNPAYRIGDIVFIEFQDNETQNPVILGKLYSENNQNSTGDLSLASLTVAVDAKLPLNVKIGDQISGEDILNAVGKINSNTDAVNFEILLDIYQSLINRIDSVAADYDLLPNER